MGFPGGTMVKDLSANAGDAKDVSSIPEAGAGIGNSLQYSCLENPMDREVWWATVHGVTESDTTEQLSPHIVCDRRNKGSSSFLIGSG